MAKKTYVLDTSALITDTDCVNSYGNNDILIPIKVLEELDKHKKRQDLVGASARTVIRFLDSLRTKGSLYEGIRLGKGKGVLRVKGYNPNMEFPPELDLDVPDHQILAVALSEKTDSRKVMDVLNTKMPSGEYKYVVNLTPLTNGFYLVSVKTDTQISTSKIIINK